MDYFEFLKQSKPNGIEDFKRCVDHVINYNGIYCFKKKKDAEKLNPTKRLLLDFYVRERDNVFNSVEYFGNLIETRFIEWDVEFNEQEILVFYEEIKDIYFLDNINNKLNDEDLKELSKYLIQIERSIWIAFYNFNIEILEGSISEKTKPFKHCIFEDVESKNFFEYLLTEWFNNLPKPISAISFVLHIMRTNDNDLETEFKGLKYKIKGIRQLDFARFWNDNYKELHKHKYSIRVDFKTARFKTFTEINTKTYINKLNEFVEKFENKN